MGIISSCTESCILEMMHCKQVTEWDSGHLGLTLSLTSKCAHVSVALSFFIHMYRFQSYIQ